MQESSCQALVIAVEQDVFLSPRNLLSHGADRQAAAYLSFALRAELRRGRRDALGAQLEGLLNWS